MPVSEVVSVSEVMTLPMSESVSEVPKNLLSDVRSRVRGRVRVRSSLHTIRYHELIEKDQNELRIKM